MSSNWSPAGINSVGEYQASGRVFLKYNQSFNDGFAGDVADVAQYDDVANDDFVQFPFITKRLMITNRAAQSIAVAFASFNLEDKTTDGDSAVKTAKNYAVIAQNETFDMHVKSKRVFIVGFGGAATSIDIKAELTHIGDSYDLTAAAQDAANNYFDAGGRQALIYDGIQGLSGIAEGVKAT